jgi:3-oxoadipate enol-lactonase
MATLRVPGAELFYEVVGHGVPIVLVHGFALDTRMWDEQVAALSDIATVVRYDARGFGRSARLDGEAVYTHADDLWLLLDHLEITRAVLVGLSMGGRIVLEAALRSPERTIVLVLLDAVLDGVPWDPESARGMRALADGLSSGGLVAAKAAWLRHDFFKPAQRSPDVARRLAEMVADYSGVHWTEPDPHGLWVPKTRPCRLTWYFVLASSVRCRRCKARQRGPLLPSCPPLDRPVRPARST